MCWNRNGYEDGDKGEIHGSKPTYGSVGTENGTGGSLRVIYCVHGKPSIGCCRVTEELLDAGKVHRIENATTIDTSFTANLSEYASRGMRSLLGNVCITCMKCKQFCSEFAPLPNNLPI